MLHYRTQAGQTLGSESRKCDKCGAMVWPEMDPTVQYTASEEIWKRSEDNCSRTREALEDA